MAHNCPAMKTTPPHQAAGSTRASGARGGLYWDGVRLVPRRDIKSVCEELGRRFKPERTVLFGSYAYGQPTPHSDVDLLVITPLKRGERAGQRAACMRQELDAPFAMDLLVRTPQFIAERLAERDMFVEQVMSRGLVMYEGEHA